MTTEATLAALRLSDQLGPTLVRKLIGVAVRIRTRETLFRDDEIVCEGAHALKDAEADRDMLRDALAADVAETATTGPVQEPVAYGLLKPDGSIDTELVGTQADCEYWSRADNEPQSGWKVTPLYAAPQQRRPLSDERLDELWRSPMSADWEHREFARLVEREHQIGETP